MLDGHIPRVNERLLAVCYVLARSCWKQGKLLEWTFQEDVDAAYCYSAIVEHTYIRSDGLTVLLLLSQPSYELNDDSISEQLRQEGIWWQHYVSELL